jgi:secreted PhoX family phosphatase
LQACAVDAVATSANRDRRWPEGQSRKVHWIDLDDPDSLQDDLRQRGAAKGATVFVRGEGLAMAADNSVFLSCTGGGANARGQIFRYQPGRGNQGRMTLFLEPDDIGILDMPDNMVVAPWGALIVCEDGSDDNFLRMVTMDGRILTLARNAHAGRKEFAGACFSPDGKTLYVNVQMPGFTYAIRGPWAAFSRA